MWIYVTIAFKFNKFNYIPISHEKIHLKALHDLHPDLQVLSQKLQKDLSDCLEILTIDRHNITTKIMSKN